MPKYEQVVISFGGKPLIVQRKAETVREMMQAGREADETRIAEGTQDAFLNAQHSLPAADWRDRYFKKRGR